MENEQAMTEYTIQLHNEDTERLFACKELEGKHDLTGNQYAALLLERELHRLFPAIPSYDEDGQLLNGHCYKGNR